RSIVWPAGSELGLDELATADGTPRAASVAVTAPALPSGPAPLMADARRLEAAFDAALATGDVSAAVNAVLELDRTLEAWSADTTQSDEPERVRATVRTMIVRLGERAVLGARDPADAAAPLVEAVLAARSAAR